MDAEWVLNGCFFHCHLSVMPMSFQEICGFGEPSKICCKDNTFFSIIQIF